MVLLALFSGVAMHQVHAQNNPIDTWGGRVEVRPKPPTLNITEGGFRSYEMRLTKQPIHPDPDKGWWVQIHVDGAVRSDGVLEEKGIRWVPSVGWEFKREAGKKASDETRWRGVTIYAIQDDDSERESVSITHELWDENAYCPPSQHGDPTVSVIVTDDDVPGIKVSPQQLTVPEGGMRTYTVKLNTQPTADVRVSVSVVPSGADVTVDEHQLTFTQDDWDDPQTVEVTADDDDDAADDEVVIRHRGSHGGYSGVQSDLEVTVTDPDTPGARVSKQSLTVPEEGSETYTVVLDTQPTRTVTVSIEVDPADSDVRVPSPFRFTSSNWNVEKTVTVRAVHDADAVNDTGITLSHDFSDGDYDEVTVPDVDVTVTDNDDPGISLSRPSLKVREGGSGTYTVKLDAQPESDVTVTVTVPSGTDLTVNPRSLMFTRQNWNSWQMVTVKADRDADTGTDPPVIVTHEAIGSSEYNGEMAELTVTIDEVDVPAVTVSDRSLTVREGGSNTYTVVLDKQPSTDVTVTVTVPSGTDLTVSPPSLMFTRQNWHMPKTFTVRAEDDDVDLPDRSVTLTHEASGGEYSPVSVASVRVTVEDNDDPGISASVPRLTVPEEGSNSYTVKLDTEPTGPGMVTVSVRVPRGTDLTVDPDSLTFDADNWFSPQTVEVMAAHDDDAVNDPVELSHSASGGGYSNVRGGTVKVTVEDNDTPGATVSRPSLSVLEGESETYTVVLHTQPTNTVTVSLTVNPANSDVGVSRRTLRFTRSNWSAAKPVRVSAAEDGDAAPDLPVAIEHEFSGGDYGDVMVDDVTVTIEENDRPGVRLSTNALQIPEGQTRSYTVVLNNPPSGNVRVSVNVSSGTGNVNVMNPPYVDFTTANWSSPMQVSVTAVKDDNSQPDSATLSHTVTGASEYSGISVGDVTVTIAETDRPPSNGPATGRPTITGTTLVGRTLTAHTTNIQDPDGLTNVQYYYQWIRVDDGVDSNIPGANGSTYRLVSADAGNRLKVRVSFTDDDGFGEERTSLETATVRRPAPPPPPPPPGSRTQTVTFDASSYSVQEGESVEVTVRLSQAPASPVTIPLTAKNEDGATNDDYSGVPANVVFDAGVTVATFTFRALADDVIEGTERVTLGFGTLPSGVNPGTRVTADVSIEEDNRGVRITPVALEVLEGGSETYTVVLESEPTGPVTVTVEGAAGDLTVAPEELTFTTLNWSARQTVTVTAAEDEDSIVDAPVTLTHTVSGGGYNGVAAPDVEVTILENDIPGVTVTPEELEVTEGSSESYTVVLDLEPEGTVEVTVGGAVEDVTVSPASLIFTTLNWSTAQTVKVMAAEDDDAVVDAAVTLTHEVSGGGYDGVTAPDVEVTIIENDIAGVTVAPEALEVPEGSSEIYTVVLDTEPTGPVTVTVGGATVEVTVAPEILTFTMSDWSTAQTVTVSAAEDDDAVVDAAVTLTHDGERWGLRRGDGGGRGGDRPRERFRWGDGGAGGAGGARGR